MIGPPVSFSPTNHDYAISNVLSSFSIISCDSVGDHNSAFLHQQNSAMSHLDHRIQRPQDNVDATGPKGAYQLSSELSLLFRTMDTKDGYSYTSPVNLSISGSSVNMPPS